MANDARLTLVKQSWSADKGTMALYICLITKAERHLMMRYLEWSLAMIPGNGMGDSRVQGHVRNVNRIIVVLSTVHYIMLSLAIIFLHSGDKLPILSRPDEQGVSFVG